MGDLHIIDFAAVFFFSLIKIVQIKVACLRILTYGNETILPNTDLYTRESQKVNSLKATRQPQRIDAYAIQHVRIGCWVVQTGTAQRSVRSLVEVKVK